eukprot:3455680-Lingulodinium_polyedra.AAC.1
MAFIVKNLLALNQKVRFLEAVNYTTIMVKADSSVAEAMAEEGRKYAKACREEGAGHSYGPPHPWMWGAMISAMAGTGEKLGQLNKKGVEEHL